MRGAFWWVDRWQQSQSYKDMTLAEQGAFRNLLDELWLRGGSLPVDERILAKLCGDAIEWPNVRKAVLLRFYKKADTLRNKTHDEVSAESKRRAKKQADYRARLGKNDGNESGNVTGNENGNLNGDVTPSPFSVHLDTDQGPETHTGRPALDGKLIDEIECPSCHRIGYLCQSPGRNGNPPGFWCRNTGGCGQNFPIDFEEIRSQLTSGARRAIGAVTPKSKAQTTEAEIAEGIRRAQERGIVLTKGVL
jgi:uncharacterized protein YdaU (DUF1376 family)